MNTLYRMLGIISLANSLFFCRCAQIVPILDKQFNAVDIFSGISGTAKVSREQDFVIPSTAQGVAVGANNTIIVGGAVSLALPLVTRFAAAALNKSGTIVWKTVFPALSAGPMDAALGVATDALGCVYLGGISIAGGPKFAAGKLDASGSLLWTSVLPSFSAGSADFANGVAVDASGCVYLGGALDPAIGLFQFAAAKLDNDGNLIWTSVLPYFSSGSADFANSVAADASGCVYLGGFSVSDSIDAQFAAAKLNNDGGLVWTAVLPSFVSGSSDQAKGITIDGSGCIYLGGFTDLALPLDQFAAAKLDNSGTLIWTSVLPHFSSGSEDKANGIAVDVSGCAYLGGSTDPLGADSQIAAAKLSGSGLLIWTSVLPYFSIGSTDTAEGIAINNSGCIYLGGDTDPSIASSQVAAAVLDIAGTVLTTATVPFVQQIPVNLAFKAVAVDSQNDIVLGGDFAFPGGGDSQFVAYKLSSSGLPFWSMPIDPLSPGASDTAQGIAVDGSGCIYLGGFTDPAAGSDQFAAVKLSSNGNLVWTSVLAPFSPGSVDKANGIAVDSAGFAYLGGISNPMGSPGQFAAAKLDSSGALLWTAVVPSFNLGSEEVANGIAVDATGSVYLGGFTIPLVALNQFAAAKLDNSGSVIWTAVLAPFSSGSADEANGIVVDPAGCVYLGGSTEVSGISRFAAVKLNSSGVPVWTAILAPFGSGSNDLARSIAIDGSGCIYLGGGVLSPLPTPSVEFAAAKLDNLGNTVWQFIAPSIDSSLPAELAQGIAIDASRSVILGGVIVDIAGTEGSGGVVKLLQLLQPIPTLSVRLPFFVVMGAA